MIQVQFEGPAGSGKSHLLALIAMTLRENGLDVMIQAESTHNAEVMRHTKQELIEELADAHIVLTEMRTFAHEK